jgi:hypothetical protein
VRIGRRNWVDWTLIALSALGVVTMLPATRRWPAAVQYVGFLLIVIALFWLAALAWFRFWRYGRRDGTPTWRRWISLLACLALSLAMLIPVIAILTFPRFFQWDFEKAWGIASVSALGLGALAARGVRFPLVLGGLATTCVVVLIPRAVL